MTSFGRMTAALGLVGMVLGGECVAGELPARNVSCRCGGALAGGSAGGYYGMAAPAVPGADCIDEAAGPIGAGPPGLIVGDAPPPVPGAPIAGPPPGTVGMTYRRPSRCVPCDAHPRSGWLSVAAPGATAMAVEGMKGYQDTDGYWQFESKEPLLPGIPHIYHVKARIGAGPDAPIEFRTVRLIPGRILDLDW